MSSIVQENDKMVSVHFDSILDVLDYTPPQKHKKLFEQCVKTEKKSPRWFGLGNYVAHQVIDKALLGDKDLYNILERYISRLDDITGYRTKEYKHTIDQVKRVKLKSSFGDELDIHKVYQGQCDTAWSRTKRIEVASKLHLVTLLIDLGGNSNQNAEDSIWRAAVAVRLMEELESAGKSVRIVSGVLAHRAFSNIGKSLTASITIKEYNQALSLERLAAMTHLGFMRTFCFGCFYSQKHNLRASLGTAGILNSEKPIQLQEEIDKGHTKYVYLSRAMDVNTAKDSLKNAYRQMEEFSNEQ